MLSVCHGGQTLLTLSCRDALGRSRTLTLTARDGALILRVPWGQAATLTPAAAGLLAQALQATQPTHPTPSPHPAPAARSATSGTPRGHTP